LDLNENNCLNIADDCHLQCHHGRVIDASGRELCECRRVPEREFHNLRVTSDDGDGDDEDDGRGYVTAAGNEALNCPKVPCTRMCPHGFQVICIFHLNKIPNQFKGTRTLDQIFTGCEIEYAESNYRLYFSNRLLDT
jgi:Antistasin family